MKKGRLSYGEYKCDNEKMKSGYLLKKWGLDKYLKGKRNVQNQQNKRKAYRSTRGMQHPVELYKLGFPLPHQIQPCSKNYHQRIAKALQNNVCISHNDWKVRGSIPTIISNPTAKNSVTQNQTKATRVELPKQIAKYTFGECTFTKLTKSTETFNPLQIHNYKKHLLKSISKNSNIMFPVPTFDGSIQLTESETKPSNGGGQRRTVQTSPAKRNVKTTIQPACDCKPAKNTSFSQTIWSNAGLVTNTSTRTTTAMCVSNRKTETSSARVSKLSKPEIQSVISYRNCSPGKLGVANKSFPKKVWPDKAVSTSKQVWLSKARVVNKSFPKEVWPGKAERKKTSSKTRWPRKKELSNAFKESWQAVYPDSSAANNCSNCIGGNVFTPKLSVKSWTSNSEGHFKGNRLIKTGKGSPSIEYIEACNSFSGVKEFDSTSIKEKNHVRSQNGLKNAKERKEMTRKRGSEDLEEDEKIHHYSVKKSAEVAFKGMKYFHNNEIAELTKKYSSPLNTPLEALKRELVGDNTGENSRKILKLA